MFFLTSLFPQIILSTSSRYNPNIRVIRMWGRKKLLVNSSPQSGPYIRMLWSRALRKFRIGVSPNINTILILGVGGGTVIELLVKSFPNAVITAVDIDPAMLTIAKAYFGIDKYPNVRLKRDDANSFIRHSAKKGTMFDLIIVDLFTGPRIPEFVSSTRFLVNLHAIVRPGGQSVINYLRELEYQKKSDELNVRLRGVFKHVEDMYLYNNRFFFIRA